jgi:Arc/MetJ-type ribon-helix-helix transcriptional regulator
MSTVQLPDHLRQVIAQQIAQGRAESEAAYIEEAVRRYAEDLDTEDEIAATAEQGIRDIEAERYATISSREDAELLHQRAITRLGDQLSADPK